MKKIPSLIDVARRAKVNISTVSRVINQTGKIGAETQERVLKVMRELGYKPNRVARRLRTQAGSTHLLGLIIPNIQNIFFADLARGVEDVAYKNNFALLLCNYDEDEAKERFYLDVMQSESVDGIIIPPIQETDQAVLQVVRNGTPVVCVDRSVSSGNLDKVEVDNHIGALRAVEHIISRGHRRIGVIGGPLDSSTGRERLRGYKDAHAQAGITLKTELIRFGDFKQHSGRVLAHELLSLSDPPTALFVCNGLMMAGALEAIAARGLKIPRQVAIVGFDELTLADVFNPPLTVVRQPAYEVGKCAAELLLKRIEDPKRPASSLKLLPELIVRKSC
ncbi:MAG: LacI family DNA-binding transcriptional regulator [bacterium]|nr:LacI family DNA-binding transcriptional regulator [bacterium]MDI1337428.1 LacI family DNA-binding transcriptional regulator [Lacunisphaera sp.]